MMRLKENTYPVLYPFRFLLTFPMNFNSFHASPFFLILLDLQSICNISIMKGLVKIILLFIIDLYQFFHLNFVTPKFEFIKT